MYRKTAADRHAAAAGGGCGGGSALREERVEPYELYRNVDPRGFEAKKDELADKTSLLAW